jgi:hypothetical protein
MQICSLSGALYKDIKCLGKYLSGLLNPMMDRFSVMPVMTVSSTILKMETIRLFVDN